LPAELAGDPLGKGTRCHARDGSPTLGPVAEAEAESFGLLARQVNDARASNPHLMYLQQQSPTTKILAEACGKAGSGGCQHDCSMSAAEFRP